MTSRSEKSRKLLIHNGKKSEVRIPFSAHDKRVIINELSLVFLFLPCVTDVRCVTQNALKSPFVIQSVIHKIVHYCPVKAGKSVFEIVET